MLSGCGFKFIEMNNSDLGSWQLVRLGDICQTTSGGTPSRKELKYYSGNIPWVKSGELDKGLIVDTEEKISEEAVRNSSAKIFPKGTLLIALYGATIGKLAFLGIEAATNQAVCGIFENENIASKYLFHFLFFSKPGLVKQGIGGAQPNISQGILKDLKIPLPPVPEQHAIVSKIEELLSELDKGKQQLETAQQQLKIYRQAVLKLAFEGKLTNENVKEGELPKGWKWVKNKDILKYVTSGSRDWKQFYSTKGSRFVRTQDINSNQLDIDNAAFVSLPEKVEGKRSLIEEGDILMTITGANVGKIAVVDFPIKDAYVSQSVALLKYNDKRITKYLWYYFQAQGFGKSFIDKLVYGVGRPVLSLENMREVDVLLCPLEDQQQIIDELERKLTVCDKIAETIVNSLQQAETLRQSILKKAFEGKLI